MRSGFAALVLSSVLAARSVSAAPPAGADEVRRAELYREGVALADHGDWQGAVRRFREVVEIRSAPKALVTLAVAEGKLGRLVESKRALERALKELKESEDAPTTQSEVVNAATDALAKLSPRIPKIQLSLPSRRGTLSLDGRVIPSQDLIEVDPGPHTIVFESEDGSRFEQRVLAKEGATTELVVKEPAAATAPTLPPPPESKPSIVGPLLVAGAGVAITGVGALAWALGKGDEADAKSACGGRTTDCPRSVESTVDGAATKIAVGNVLLGVGAATIAGGALWWLLTPRGTKPLARAGVSPIPAGGYLSYATSF